MHTYTRTGTGTNFMYLLK